MTKFKEYYERMFNENKDLFAEFQKVHDEYALNPDDLQDQFNEIGKKVQRVMRIYEDRLCGHSESNGYGAYTGGLAEKFEGEVRKHFSQIDNVGLIVKKFSLKKINL